MENGAEMGPRGHLGAKGSQEGKKVQKVVLINPVWGTILDTFCCFAGARFFSVFFEGLFSLPWPH